MLASMDQYSICFDTAMTCFYLINILKHLVVRFNILLSSILRNEFRIRWL